MAEPVEIYALSDLHLGPGSGKGHYSSSWKEHQTKMRKAWDERIPENGLVLMPGDFSWHTDPDDLKYDYYWINDRPGFKLVSPGNHDYGVWDNQERAYEFCKPFDRMRPLMGDALRIPNPLGDDKPGVVIAGTCGTSSPGDKYFDSNSGVSSAGQDKEILRFFNELARLKAALDRAKTLQRSEDSLVVMFHYPPFADGKHPGPFSNAIEAAGADLCVYGHLHQESQWKEAFQGVHHGCDYRFVGADFLDFKPTRLGDLDETGMNIGAIECTEPPKKVWTGSGGGGNTSNAWGEDDWEAYGYGTYYHAAPAKSTGQTQLPVGAPAASTPRKSDGSAPKKPIDENVMVDAFGEARVCAECGFDILKNEPYHFALGGAIHGHGAYKEEGTCLFAQYKQEDAEYERGTGRGSISTGGTTASATQPVLDPQGKTRACAACGQNIFSGEAWHQSAKGPLHGASAYDAQATCEPIQSSSRELVVASKPKQTKEAAENPPAKRSIAGLKRRTGKNKKQGMTCRECGRSIFKKEAWHHIPEGKIHGYGKYTQTGTCNKEAAPGWEKPADAAQASKNKPAKTAAKNPAPASNSHWKSPTTTNSYRPSSLTLSEAKDLDKLADRYMENKISRKEFEKKAQKFVKEAKVYTNTGSSSGGTTTSKAVTKIASSDPTPKPSDRDAPLRASTLPASAVANPSAAADKGPQSPIENQTPPPPMKTLACGKCRNQRSVYVHVSNASVSCCGQPMHATTSAAAATSSEAAKTEKPWAIKKKTTDDTSGSTAGE